MMGRSLGFVFSFAIPVVLIRLLTQVDFGTYKQFFLLAGTLVAILDVGTAASLFYFIPVDQRRAANYLLQTVLVSATLALVAAGALWLLRYSVAAWLNSPLLAELIPFLTAYIVLELLGSLLEYLVIIEKQAKLGALLFAGSDGLRAISLLLPAILTGDLRWLAAGAAVYASIRFAVFVLWVRWQYRSRYQPGFRLVQFDGQIRYSLPFAGAGILDRALFTFHSFYVATVFSPAVFAIYAVGCTQIAPVQIFFKSLFEVTLVRMTEHLAARDLAAARTLWLKLIGKQATVVIPLVVILWLLASPFIEGIFTADYLEATPIFRIYLLMILLTMFNDHSVLRARAQTRFIFFANVVALAACVLLVPILTRQLGVRGAAVGLIGGVVTMKSLGLLRAAQMLEVPLRDMIPWEAVARVSAGSLLAAAVVYPMTGLIGVPLLRFFACGAAFWLAYSVIAWFGKILTVDEKNLIARTARSVFPVPRALRQ
jgi:O-antigen/teichoic acid export membrane protein